MTLKDILDEELSLNSVGDKMSQLGIALTGLSRKIATNPLLAQALGQDFNNINKLSGDTQNDFKALVKQNMADQRKEQQQESEKQKMEAAEEQRKRTQAILANKNQQVTGVNNTATSANSNPRV